MKKKNLARGLFLINKLRGNNHSVLWGSFGENFRIKLKGQGDALTFFTSSLKNSSDYWRKYNTIAIKF